MTIFHTDNLPKLLVLGSSLPGARHGGGVVKDEILRRYPKDRYVCFATRPLAEREEPESLRGVPCLARPLVPRPRMRGARFYMPVLHAIGFGCIAPLRVRQAIAFGRRHGVELVWAELQGDAVVLAQKVAEGLGVPFVGTVWDDPEGWLRDEGYDSFSRRRLWRCFREAMRNARNLSTAGEAMQRAYKQEYGVDSVVLRHGFETPASPLKGPRDDTEALIGFVGNTYGRDAWMAFLAAIARLNASGRLPRIRVRAFSAGEFPHRCNGVDVENRGWQPSGVILREIAETDFCYLPYWFEPSKRRHVELSFPNKFETYVAAGRPILFHGPDYAGVAETIRQYGVGLCVDSLDGDAISAALQRLVRDASLRDSLSRASVEAFHAEFNMTVLIKNFARLIGVDPRVLLGSMQS